jgi:hypothetical protein
LPKQEKLVQLQLQPIWRVEEQILKLGGNKDFIEDGKKGDINEIKDNESK